MNKYVKSSLTFILNSALWLVGIHFKVCKMSKLKFITWPETKHFLTTSQNSGYWYSFCELLHFFFCLNEEIHTDTLDCYFVIGNLQSCWTTIHTLFSVSILVEQEIKAWLIDIKTFNCIIFQWKVNKTVQIHKKTSYGMSTLSQSSKVKTNFISYCLALSGVAIAPLCTLHRKALNVWWNRSNPPVVDHYEHDNHLRLAKSWLRNLHSKSAFGAALLHARH